MALTPNSIQAALLARRVPFQGAAFDPMALGIALGVFSWAVSQPQNLALTGFATGTAGAGVITPPTTRIIVPAAIPTVSSALMGAGFNGPLSLPLATTIAGGISDVFSVSAQYAGTAAGVGVGQDVSRITVANAPTLQTSLLASLTGTLGSGPLVPLLSQGLALGIAAMLLLGTGTGTVTGASSPFPGSGVTTSLVV